MVEDALGVVELAAIVLDVAVLDSMALDTVVPSVDRLVSDALVAVLVDMSDSVTLN